MHQKQTNISSLFKRSNDGWPNFSEPNCLLMSVSSLDKPSLENKFISSKIENLFWLTLIFLSIKPVGFSRWQWIVKIIYQLIQDSEKNFGTHIDNLAIMVDAPDLFSIDLSIRKKFDKKKI